MTPEGTLIAIASTLTALGVIAIFAKKSFSAIRKMVRFLDEWLGTDEKPGIVQRLDKIEYDVAAIHKEVTYNSGTSLKDAVHRIEEFQKVNHKRIEVLEEIID